MAKLNFSWNKEFDLDAGFSCCFHWQRLPAKAIGKNLFVNFNRDLYRLNKRCQSVQTIKMIFFLYLFFLLVLPFFVRWFILSTISQSKVSNNLVSSSIKFFNSLWHLMYFSNHGAHKNYLIQPKDMLKFLMLNYFHFYLKSNVAISTTFRILILS